MEFKRKLDLAIRVVHKDGIKGARNLLSNYITLKKEPLMVDSYPLIVKMEPTIDCNLRCIMCDRTYWDRQANDMSFDSFKLAIDRMPFATTVNLQGLGEPLLNKDLFKMIEYAKSKKIEIGFFTNATLLTDEIADKLIKSNVDYINISLDAADPKTYEQIRVNAKYDNVMRNIRNFIAKRKQLNVNRPKISVWTVLFDANYDELPGLVKLAKDIDVDEYVVQSAHSWGKDYMKDNAKREEMDHHYTKTLKLMKEAKRLANQLGLNFRFTTLYPDPQSLRKCAAPWLTTYVTTDGYITPCCMQASDPRLINFGNIHEQTFEEIWNSEGYKAFRKEMKEGMPKVCEGCPAWFYESG